MIGIIVTVVLTFALSSGSVTSLAEWKLSSRRQTDGHRWPRT